MNTTEQSKQTAEIASALRPIENMVSGTFLDNSLFYIIVIAGLTFAAAYIVKFLFREIFTKLFKKTKTDIDNQIIEIVEKPIFRTVLWIGLLVGAFIFLSEYVWWTYVYKTILSIIIIVWALAGLRVVKVILEYLSKKRSVDFIKKQTMPLFDNLAFLIFFIVGFYIIADSVWDVDMTAFIASLGVLGLAVGFAAKDTIANLFAGVFILADQPYKIGDYIILDSGERGRVRHIGIRSTRVLTRSDVEITIPNSIIGNTKITNESGGPVKKTRVFIDVSVAYGSNVARVEKVILKALEKVENIETDPEPQVRLKLLGASSLDLQVRFWVADPSKKGSAVHAVNTAVYDALNRAKIEIPYQKQDLYIKELPKQ